MNKIHNVFNVPLSWKAKIEPSRVLPQVPIKVQRDSTIETKLIKILDWGEKVLRNKRVPLVKILYRNSQIKEET